MAPQSPGVIAGSLNVHVALGNPYGKVRDIWGPQQSWHHMYHLGKLIYHHQDGLLSL
jgi:hypothetical protein